MKKSDVKTREHIEEYYTKCRKIKFDNYTPTSLEDLFHSLVSGVYATTYLRGGKHCDKHRARSIDDYIILAKFYYPEKSVKEIISEMRSFVNNINTVKKDSIYNKASLSYCSHIRKNNFYMSAYGGTSIKSLDNVIMRHQGFINCNLKFNEIY